MHAHTRVPYTRLPVCLTRACLCGRRYVNAGTVEFLVDPKTWKHYFIEVNPRIQARIYLLLCARTLAHIEHLLSA